MKIVSEVKSQKEFDEMKTIMEIFVVNHRVRQLALDAWFSPFLILFFLKLITYILIIFDNNFFNYHINYRKTTSGVVYGRKSRYREYFFKRTSMDKG